MDRSFERAFTKEIRAKTAQSPFDWLAPLINDVRGYVLDGTGLKLRADGFLFLLVNCAYMIVIPWEETKKKSFRGLYANELSDDLRDIVERAITIAQQRGSTEISANILLEAIGTRETGMRTRGLNIWGP